MPLRDEPVLTPLDAAEASPTPSAEARPNGSGLPPDSFQEHALDAVSVAAMAAARGNSPAEVIESVLNALRDCGYVECAVAEVHAELPVRYSVGDDARVAALGSPRDLVPPMRTGHAAEIVLCGGVHVVHVPVRSSLSAYLVVTLSEGASAGCLRPISSVLGIALDRVTLEEQQARIKQDSERPIREIASLYDIGQATDHVRVTELLEMITEKAASVMDAQACSLMTLDPERKVLSIAASHGLSDDVVEATNLPLGEGIAGRVAQSGEPMLIVDAKVDPQYLQPARRQDVGSSMVVPMKDPEGRVLGVLSIRRRRPQSDFTQEDLPLFSVFATHASLAISNRRLYEELRNRIHQLSTLSELTRSLIVHLNLGDLLEAAAASVTDLLKFDRCAFFLFDRTSKHYVARAIRGYPPEVFGRDPIKIGEGVVGLAAHKQMPIVVNDARREIQPIRSFARSLGTASFLAIPVVWKGQSIGVVVADNKATGRPIHEDSLDLLSAFNNQAALAIENALLYEDREARYLEMTRLATQTENILRSIAASVVVLDETGKVTRWNLASEEMWGLREEEVLGKRFASVLAKMPLPADTATTLRSRVQTVLSSGKPYQYHKLRGLEEATHRFLNVLFSPVARSSGGRHGAVLIFEDATQDVLLQEEMQRLSRLADQGELAASMAHEVRNPLSSIKGAAQLMRGEREDDPALCTWLDVIIDEVNGLSRITTELLDFARPLQMELQTSSLGDILERSVLFLGPELASNHVRVEFAHEEVIPPIVCDPQRLEQVVRNIVLNAAQAMPAGGTLRIDTSFDSASGLVAVDFTDTGVGIPRDRIETVFQPFVTTKTKGTGLGLAVVRKIVESHGGQIAVASDPGRGTTFTVRLPLMPPARVLPETIRVPEPAAFRGGLPDD